MSDQQMILLFYEHAQNNMFSVFFIKTHIIFTSYTQFDNTENLVYYFKESIAL